MQKPHVRQKEASRPDCKDGAQRLEREKQAGQDAQRPEAAALRIYLATDFWQEGGDMIRFSL